MSHPSPSSQPQPERFNESLLAAATSRRKGRPRTEVIVPVAPNKKPKQLCRGCKRPHCRGGTVCCFHGYKCAFCGKYNHIEETCEKKRKSLEDSQNSQCAASSSSSSVSHVRNPQNKTQNPSRSYFSSDAIAQTLDSLSASTHRTEPQRLDRSWYAALRSRLSSITRGTHTRPALLPVVLNLNTVTLALVDTGADKSFISEEYATNMYQTDVALTVTTADNTNTTMNLMSNVHVNIGNRAHDMYVAPSLIAPCILGLDFLARHKISVHPHRGCIELSDGTEIAFCSRRYVRNMLSCIHKVLPKLTASKQGRIVTTVHKPLVQLDSTLTESERARVRNFVDDMSYCFAKSPTDLGCSKNFFHRMRPKGKAFRMKAKAMSPSEINLENNCIHDMEERSVVRPGNGPWASRSCIVRKKDGKPRFCVNFCRLNSQEEDDAYPLIGHW